ncbi:MAG: ABC transporter substrate-binding protein [Proteobacteria bacterium]|nr:ABC transporter substrate-binding protein [Pseudomonadota bacterium]
MKRNMNYGLFFILGTLLLLFLTFSMVMPVMAGPGLKTPQWKWTKEAPKPEWWVWGDTYFKGQPARGGVLQMASLRYVGYMNPNHWPVNDWQVIANVYEGRFNFNGEYKQRNPWLAESWEFVSPTVVLVKFKEGITYHDGTELTAKTVKYLFEWIKDPKNGCWTRGTLSKFKSLEVADKYTIKWTTYKPWASFPVGFFGFLISAKALETDVLLKKSKQLTAQAKRFRKKADKAAKKAGRSAKAAAKAKKAEKKAAKLEKQATKLAAEMIGKKSTDVHPVGTGAFMFDSALPGNWIKLKRNPNWWFGRSIGNTEMPYFDGIRTTVIPDPAIQLANLRAGKIDNMPINKAQYAMIKRDPRINVHVFPDNSTETLIFNHAKGPFRDIRVRKAISHAIDRKALIYGTQFGLARIASCIYPDDHWAHNPKLKPVSYDPELSKKLLAEAGYAKGLTLTGFMTSDPANQTKSIAIKQMLSKIGVDWKVQALEPAAINDKLQNLEFDMGGRYEWYIQDPGPQVRKNYHPEGAFNHGRSNNKKLIGLIEAGAIELDEAKRQQIYFEIEEELHRNYEDVWLYWETAVLAHREELQGFNLDMFLKGRHWYVNTHPMWFKDGRR